MVASGFGPCAAVFRAAVVVLLAAVVLRAAVLVLVVLRAIALALLSVMAGRPGRLWSAAR